MNKWYKALEVKDQKEATSYFYDLCWEVIDADHSLRNDRDHAKEIVVANLCYAAGDMGPHAQDTVSKFYTHFSPYRNGEINGRNS